MSYENPCVFVIRTISTQDRNLLVRVTLKSSSCAVFLNATILIYNLPHVHLLLSGGIRNFSCKSLSISIRDMYREACLAELSATQDIVPGFKKLSRTSQTSDKAVDQSSTLSSPNISSLHAMTIIQEDLNPQLQCA